MIVAPRVNSKPTHIKTHLYINLDYANSMRTSKTFYIILLLFISSPSFANGGPEMAVMLVWLYTIVVIAFWGIVLLLRNRQLYKHLWLLIISLLISVAATLLLMGISTVVKSEAGLDISQLPVQASIIGMIIYALFVCWTFIIPIKQYAELNKPNQ